MESVKRLGKSLSVLTGQVIEVLDVDDNRLTHLLTHLSQEAVRDAIERLLGERCVEIYELRPKGVHCDTITASGHHQVTTDGVMPFGHSTGDPTLPPGKLATANLDVGGLGWPLATVVWSGERADDGLYVPLATPVTTILQQTGRLWVGDSKMSSQHHRETITTAGQLYLCLLPMTGETGGG